MQCLPSVAYQGDEHVVFIAGHCGMAKCGDMVDATEGDLSFAGLEERFDGRPGSRSGLRRRLALYAASACCTASAGATFHGSSSSMRLIGDALENVP